MCVCVCVCVDRNILYFLHIASVHFLLVSFPVFFNHTLNILGSHCRLNYLFIHD